MSKKAANSQRLPLVELPISRQQAEDQAYKNLRLINEEGTLKPLMREFMVELEQDNTNRAKMNRLKRVADKINAIATPKSACKAGCSYCCHISAVITQTEADALGAASGRKVKKLTGVATSVEDRMKWFGKPCPFLKNGRCSVYADRPLVCRMLFNLADSPYFCNTDIPPEESHVTMLNLQELERGYLMAFLTEPWGDIRDFFPS
ncbi:MAG: YkgJ family cysteine cluster protein [Hafnia sp.]